MVEQKNEVVISGVGGMYPECGNMDELKHLLFNKMNGVTIDSRRWVPDELGVASGTGKMKDIDRFDGTFFNVHPKLTEVMDILTRFALERSIEAIIDAGLNPADLHGSNTAVFMGTSSSETEMLMLDSSKSIAFSMLGQSRTMQANRVSYILNLTGPSFIMDGNWTCGAIGLQKAKKMIENGVISSAIVGVTSLALRPELQLQSQGLNKLNRTDRTKSFSSDADGYNRSEACIVLYLQKASEAKRSYGTLLNVKSTQFGDHGGHIIGNVGNHFKSLLLDTYGEVNVDPATVDFVEAYGSGIKTDDSMELKVMEEVFCTNRRKTPLKIGSVKSNVGHCEPSGLLMSIIKAIIALDGGYIPPNINYGELNKNCPPLNSGKIRVITEKTPLAGDIIGISAFGRHNAFSHVILKRNPKPKTNDAAPGDYVPRLIFASGRNEENTRQTIEKIKSHGHDAEFIALTHGVFANNINSHFYRSFTVHPNLDASRLDDVRNVNLKKRPVWFIFSGMGSQWPGMGAHLMKLPIFADAINKCDRILKPRGVDIKSILTSLEAKTFDNILNSFVGIAAIQIGLVDVLRALDVQPDGIIGHSVGELGCAYADGCFTAEEMILSAYARGRASAETILIPGMMAAVGLGYDQIKDRVPRDIDVACRNSATSCTISGPVDSVDEFVERLKSEGIFAKTVNVAGIAYHSRYIQPAGPTLLKYLKEVIAEPKRRSSKWISTSLPESKWDTELAKYSSPEYHTNNLLSSVLFEDALKHVPSDAIAIEIAPHGLLQAIVNRALPETVTNIPLTKRIYSDSVRILLTAVGHMYTNGLNPNIQELYPKIAYPVSRETPSIHGLPFWDHTQQWSYLDKMNKLVNANSNERITSLTLNDDIHLTEYGIRGQPILPLSFILCNVWEAFDEINTKTVFGEPIRFDNLLFKHDVKIVPTSVSENYLMIQPGTGNFEYNIDDEIVLSGKVSYSRGDDCTTETAEQTPNTLDFEERLFKHEIYAALEKVGFHLGDNFKNLTDFRVNDYNIRGCVTWNNDWVYFLDGLFKVPLLRNFGTCQMDAPVSVRQINITPATFGKYHGGTDIFVDYNIKTKVIACDGIKISDVKYVPLNVPELKSDLIVIQEQTFVRFDDRSNCQTIEDFIYDSMRIILEADKLNYETDGKLIVCNPYHYNDSLSQKCAKLLKEIVESQPSINSVTMSWDNVACVSEGNAPGRFITVTNVDNMQETTKALAKKDRSYVIVCANRTIRDCNDWKIIAQQKLNETSYLALMTKRITLEGNAVFIKKSIDATVAWDELQKYSSSEVPIYVIWTKEPSGGADAHVEQLLTKYKTPKLRFVFILDPSAPAFENNKAFYAKQLCKGLVVNIYKMGGWGTYKRAAVERPTGNAKIAESLAFQRVLSDRHTEITAKYLGLNFKHLVAEDNAKNEFGPVEYSGVDENNETVMGIGWRTSSRTQYDSVLSWPVPAAWSLEDAATVPLAYAMAYYVFNVLCPVQTGHQSVLVTSGSHPVGRAAIAVGLAAHRHVYAIVESKQHAEWLSGLFPKLPRSRILVNVNDKFDVQLKMMTKGVDLILNFLSGEAFQAAFRTIADHGKFCHFSKSDMDNHGSVGTRVFLRNIAFSVVTPNLLFNEPAHGKQTVRKALVNGINEGVVKPFTRSTLAAPCDINDVFDTMRTASPFTYEKVIVPVHFENSTFQDTYRCSPDQIYVIVDNNQSNWLDLAEWLVDRGARNFVISVKRCSMTSTGCRKLDRLISRNSWIQIVSDSCLKTKEESVAWLNRITLSRCLGSLFVVNQFDDDRITNLRYAFEEHKNKVAAASFVCISGKGEHVCSELQSTGVKAVHISWDGTVSRSKNVATILPTLDKVLRKFDTGRSCSFVYSEKRNERVECSQQINDLIAKFFPESADELYLLNEKITKEAAAFVEIATMSPRYSQQKSVTPVFVIPGFKPKLVEKLYRRLHYPAFEARLPERIGSVDALAEILVNKIAGITAAGYVSLIGESWGGTVALKMAQILEARGTMVTVALLEGDPDILTEWAGSFLADDRFENKANTTIGTFAKGFTKYAVHGRDEEPRPQSAARYRKVFLENTDRALNIIRSRLRAFLESSPLPNKLLTKVTVFTYQRGSGLNKKLLNDYCVNRPLVYNVPNTDYTRMMVDKTVIEKINKSVVPTYSVGIELSLEDKYKNYYFDVERTINM